nr:hypothetical protein [Tanacetum cinerariifolium]
MRIEQYFLMTDYSLWGVILNGDSPVPTRVVEDVLQPVAPTTAEKKLAKNNELKARDTDGSNREEVWREHRDQKVQKTLLKQQYENFTGLSSESLDQIHDRLQKLRNKTDLKEQSLDDLFNSLKIYEAEVKHSSSTGTTIQNLAFVSTSNTDSTTESVSAAASVSAICAKMHVSSLPNVDSLNLRWQMAMLTMRARIFLQKTRRNLGANGPTSIGFDMSKVKCYSCHRKGHFARECRSSKDSRRNGAAKLQRRTVPVETSTSNALVSQCDGVGSYDWIFKQRRSLPIMHLWIFLSTSSSSDNEVPSCSKACSKAYAQLYSQYDKLTADFRKLQFDVISYQTESDESCPPSSLYYSFQPNDGYHAVPLPYPGTFMPPKPDLHVETSIPVDTPKPVSPKPISTGKRRNRKACFVCKILEHLLKDCDYHAKKMAQPIIRNHAHRGNHKQYAPLTHTNPQNNMGPAAVITQSKPVSITTVRPVSAVVSQIKMTRPKQVQPIVTKPKSPIRSHITRSPSPKTSNSPPIVTTVKAPVVSAAQGLQGKWE